MLRMPFLLSKPAPRLFTKLMKFRISVMQKLNVRFIMFLDDIFSNNISMEGANKSMEHFDTCSPSLGFLIKKIKSVLLPCQILQFVGGEIHSKEMSASLPQQKKVTIVSQCSGKRIDKGTMSSFLHHRCSVSKIY